MTYGTFCSQLLDIFSIFWKQVLTPFLQAKSVYGAIRGLESFAQLLKLEETRSDQMDSLGDKQMVRETCFSN